MVGTGHQSLQLMFILKAPNVHSGWLLPTKEVNDFHASFFPTLIPLPRLQGLCCCALRLASKPSQKLWSTGGVSGRLSEGPTLPSWHL